ncbi:9938_t:CDS:2 [Scutellospora calospora]|uniref:9938_t:CDS:1 n=1 Tax=Scutellospora calospora TaxID=85575 RepID=A0ACA9KL17_9GLOM|nr:9938_t:CDS:2 [Scutellospora calospora]
MSKDEEKNNRIDVLEKEQEILKKKIDELKQKENDTFFDYRNFTKDNKKFNFHHVIDKNNYYVFKFIKEELGINMVIYNYDEQIKLEHIFKLGFSFSFISNDDTSFLIQDNYISLNSDIKVAKIYYEKNVIFEDVADEIIETLSKRSKTMNYFERENFYKLLNNSLKRQQTCDCSHKTKINKHQRLWKILTS